MVKMSNKKVIKKVFDEEYNSERVKQQILLKYERKNKIFKIMRYSIVPVFFVLLSFIVILLNNSENILDDNIISTMRVYAYTMSEDDNMEKVELRDNVKLLLSGYNFAMSSVPGYPIMFELHNVDYLKIDVTNGTILDWDNITGEVNNIGSTYKLFDDNTLYFNVSINTNIKITGIKNKKEVFEKNITILSDDSFNYYAVLKY